MSDQPITSDQVTPRGDDGTNVPGTGAVADDKQVSQREDAVSDLGRDPGAAAPDAEQTSVTTEVKTEASAPPAPDAAPEPDGKASAPEADNQS